MAKSKGALAKITRARLSGCKVAIIAWAERVSCLSPRHTDDLGRKDDIGVLVYASPYAPARAL